MYFPPWHYFCYYILYLLCVHLFTADIDNFTATLLYRNLMITTNQKSIINIDTKKKRSLNIALKSHQISRTCGLFPLLTITHHAAMNITVPRIKWISAFSLGCTSRWMDGMIPAYLTFKGTVRNWQIVFQSSCTIHFSASVLSSPSSVYSMTLDTVRL